MSILNVEHLTHGFGDRAIFHDVSFRLLKGEHIGLVDVYKRQAPHTCHFLPVFLASFAHIPDPARIWHFHL